MKSTTAHGGPFDGFVTLPTAGSVNDPGRTARAAGGVVDGSRNGVLGSGPSLLALLRQLELAGTMRIG